VLADACGGQIVDATIVSAPRQRDTREENAAIKAGRTPEGWEEKPAKNAQKDKDARWTKKNDKIRLQEPHQHRPQAQADPPLGRDRRLGARQPEARRGAGQVQHRHADNAFRSAESEAKLKAKGTVRGEKKWAGHGPTPA
jgi:hypothetical protein